MKKRSNFIVQGSILAIAGVLSRIIGIIRSEEHTSELQSQR